MSVIIEDAMRTYQAMRDEFEVYRHALYERACAELKGELVNRRGQSLGIDPYSLFVGTSLRAHAYATDQLVEWWQANGRPTVETYEAQWWAGREGVLA